MESYRFIGQIGEHTSVAIAFFPIMLAATLAIPLEMLYDAFQSFDPFLDYQLHIHEVPPCLQR
jgi:hypothetical protein